MTVDDWTAGYGQRRLLQGRGAQRVCVLAAVLTLVPVSMAHAADGTVPAPARKADVLAGRIANNAEPRDLGASNIVTGTIRPASRNGPDSADTGNIRIPPVRRQKPTRPDKPAALRAWLSRF